MSDDIGASDNGTYLGSLINAEKGNCCCVKENDEKSVDQRSIFKYVFNRYVLFILIVFLVTGIPATIFFSNLVANLFIESFENTSVAIVKSDFKDATKGKPINEPVTGKELKSINSFVDETGKNFDFQEINVWSLDGTLVFSSTSDGLGQKRKIEGPFAEALKDRTVSEIEHRGDPEVKGGGEKVDVLEVYIPIHNQAGKLINIFEIYAPLDPVQKLITTARTIMISFFIVLFVIVAAIGQTGVVLITKKDQRYEIEREISNTLQDALIMMPSKIRGIEFSYDYHSATKAARVGGDFYDIYELSRDKVCIVIGDVSGLGIKASNLTDRVKNTIRAYSYDSDSPSKILEKTTILINEMYGSPNFVSVFFGILDLKTSTLKYCSAGHPPVILKRGINEIKKLITFDLPIGFYKKVNYHEQEESLKKGDILILYTDGLIEARKGIEFFDEDRLVNLIREVSSTDTEKILNLLVKEVLEFTNNELNDDMAVMVISLKV